MFIFSIFIHFGAFDFPLGVGGWVRPLWGAPKMSMQKKPWVVWGILKICCIILSRVWGLGSHETSLNNRNKSKSDFSPTLCLPHLGD